MISSDIGTLLNGKRIALDGLDLTITTSKSTAKVSSQGVSVERKLCIMKNKAFNHFSGYAYWKEKEGLYFLSSSDSLGLFGFPLPSCTNPITL